MVRETKESTNGENLSGRLQAYLAHHEHDVEVFDFQFLTSGFESEVYTFGLRFPSQMVQHMILRLYPGQGAAQKMIREAKGLQQLHQDGYPVPEMYLYEPGKDILGYPFSILQKLNGRSMWPVLAQAGPVQAAELLERFGALIARLHRLDWHSYTERTELYDRHPEVTLEEMRTPLRKLYLRFDLRGCLAVLDWLESQQAKIRIQPAVVHLDLHANNVFLLDDSPKEPMAVIDWTQIGVSDYRVDLCWTLMIMGDYGSPQWAERILQAYQQSAGHPLKNLDYFYVFAYTKLLGSTLISLKADPKELGLRQTTSSFREQTPVLLRLSGKIRELTGLQLPEVDDLLSQAGLKD